MEPISTAPGDGIPDLTDGERFKRVIRRIHDVPSFPRVVDKLIEVSSNPRSSSRDLAAVMENDQGLSAKILKLVNSAFYSLSRPVASLQHAVTLLGYNSIRSLAMSVSVKGTFGSMPGSFDLEAFWSHSLATALAARTLAERQRSPRKEDAFTAGLLHDIGLLIEARYFAEELAEILRRVHDDEETFEQAEQSVLGIRHRQLGHWLAQRWRLPEELSEAILRHEQPQEELVAAAPEVVEIVDFVAVANHLAHALGHLPIPGSEAAPLDVESLSPARQQLLGSDVNGLLAEVAERFESSREFLDV